MGSVKKKSDGNDTSLRADAGAEQAPEFAVCIYNEGYPVSLELHKIYRLLPDEQAAADGDVRVIDESGEDYLYPAGWFVRVRLPQKVRASLVKAS